MGLSEKFSNLVTIILLGYLIFSVFIQHKEIAKNESLGVGEQTELTTHGPFLNSSGQLIESGWSRKYMKEFNHEQIYPVWLGLNILKNIRIKRFEYYSFLANNKLVQIAVANLGYAASAFINVFDYELKTWKSFQEKMLPIIDSKIFPILAENPFNCSTISYSFAKNDFVVNVRQELIQNEGVCRSSIAVQVGKQVQANFVSNRKLAQEDHFEITPVFLNNKYFYYNLKSYDNSCQGFVLIDGEKTTTEIKDCVGMTDFGRGVFMYKTNWVWGSGYGRLPNRKVLSLNFGGGIGSNEKSVDDWFKLDGEIHKLNPAVLVYDKLNLMNGMTLRTNSQFSESKHFIDVVFQPYKDALVAENIIVVTSSLQYVYGTYSGRVVDSQGVETVFEDIPGIIEWGKFKW